jgi:hypothetical protein
MKSYSEIVLIPNLHLNTVTLIGQKNIDNYIAVRQVKDAFYAISNEPIQNPNWELGECDGDIRTRLITWDLLTGKLMSDIPHN